MDATICRGRTDYEVIESDQLESEDEGDESSDQAEEEEQEQESSPDVIEQNNDESEGHNLVKLVKSGKSGDTEEVNEDTSGDDVEELDEDDQLRRPSFLDYGKGDDSENSIPLESHEHREHHDDEEAKRLVDDDEPHESLIINQSENGSDYHEINSYLVEMNKQARDYSPKKVNDQSPALENIPFDKMDIFGKKDDEVDHEEEVDNQAKVEGSARDENSILVNNQKFQNNVFSNSDENNKLEEEFEQINKKPKEPKHRAVNQSVYEDPFCKKLSRLVGNELPHESGFSLLTNKLKMSVFGLSEDQADQLMRIDESYPELSNQDVILAKPGSIVKKCWRLKNLGSRQWPKDTRLVSVTDNLFFEGPAITHFLKPGEMMDIGARIFVPDTEQGDSSIKEYILRLFCNEFQWFGEPIIATCHLDEKLFDDQVAAVKDPQSDEALYPRVTADPEIVENYQIAKELCIKNREPFNKVLRDLKKADDQRNMV